jgi:Tfp pilus assembly protein FimT
MLTMLVIIVILMLVSIPVYDSIIQYYHITTAATDLYSSIQYARTEAIKRNTAVYMSFTTGSSWCYGINTGSACNCGTPSSCNLGTVTASAANILTLSATGLSSNAFYFDNTHGGASTSVTLTYTLFGQASLIQTSVSMLGDVSVCSTGITGYTAC